MQVPSRVCWGDAHYAALRRILVLALAALLWWSAGCSDDPLAGSAGLGDGYLPKAGNGGYDVTHYALDLTVDPASGRLEGVVTVEATAKQDLTSPCFQPRLPLALGCHLR